MTKNSEEVFLKNDDNLSQTNKPYEVKLENFEGPLDLLLHLIKDDKLDIETVKLADLTQQYLEFMKDIEFLDMERASEFIVVAATLIEIKSKTLLPVESKDMIEEDDSGAILLQRLKEYKLYKEASEKLQLFENVDRMYKEPDKTTEKFRIVLKDMVLDKLLNSFVDIITRIKLKERVEQVKNIEKDKFTVAEKMLQIKKLLADKSQIKFTDLFKEEHTKSEVITVFMAVLELLKLQTIKAKQFGMFGDIFIEYKGVPNE
ncbi:MAG: segregation/condensation protein A [Clostridia bacterium]